MRCCAEWSSALGILKNRGWTGYSELLARLGEWQLKMVFAIGRWYTMKGNGVGLVMLLDVLAAPSFIRRRRGEMQL